MKRLLVGFAICCLALAGCGGNGQIISVYSGTYSGSYNETGDTGTVNLNVDEFGNLSGQTVSGGSGGTYNISGTVSDSNSILVTLTLSTNSATIVSLSGSFTPGTPVNNVLPVVVSMTTTGGVADTWNLNQTSSTFSKRQTKK